MDCRYILLFLIISQVAFANDCVGYNDSFDVRVLDAKLRPIPDAEVQVRYDRGATFGSKYFVTPPKYTDASGKVPFEIWTLGTTARPMDCYIYINATIGGRIKEKKVTANEHGPIVDVILDNVYPVSLYVRDSTRTPIENASVTVGEKIVKTDENGLARFYYKTGEYPYLASYLDARKAGVLEIEDDTMLEVLFTFYSVQLDIIDDTGIPLEATLTIFNQTFELDDGHFEHEKSFGELIPYTVNHRGIIKTGSILPEVNTSAVMVYDVHAPLFGDITPQTTNNWTKLMVEASDPGEFASGLNVSSIRVTYRLEPAEPTDPWNTAVTFSTGYNTFAAEFPELPPNSIVNFRIEIKDKEGNRADIDGKFTTFRGDGNAVGDGEGPVNDTQNQTNAQVTEPEMQEIPPFYIVGGAILLILIVYMVIRLKRMASGSV